MLAIAPHERFAGDSVQRYRHEWRYNRRGRKEFLNKRSRGGGIALFIRNDINIEIILEQQTIRIMLGASSYCIINVYLPPYRSRQTMIDEFAKILGHVRKSYGKGEIITVGDFNSPNIIWKLNDALTRYFCHWKKSGKKKLGLPKPEILTIYNQNISGGKSKLLVDQINICLHSHQLPN